MLVASAEPACQRVESRLPCERQAYRGSARSCYDRMCDGQEPSCTRFRMAARSRSRDQPGNTNKFTRRQLGTSRSGPFDTTIALCVVGRDGGTKALAGKWFAHGKASSNSRARLAGTLTWAISTAREGQLQRAASPATVRRWEATRKHQHKSQSNTQGTVSGIGCLGDG
jgi:hypothetical protein